MIESFLLGLENVAQWRVLLALVIGALLTFISALRREKMRWRSGPAIPIPRRDLGW